MARKVIEKEEVKKKVRLTTLEKTDYAAFVRELHLKDADAKDWARFQKQVAAEIRKNRIESTPYLTPAKMARKIGVTQPQIAMWENGNRHPQLFNLWLCFAVMGRKIEIKFI